MAPLVGSHPVRLIINFNSETLGGRRQRIEDLFNIENGILCLENGVHVSGIPANIPGIINTTRATQHFILRERNKLVETVNKKTSNSTKFINAFG